MTSTNGYNFIVFTVAQSKNCLSMVTTPSLDLMLERVETLLTRYEQLQRAHASLQEQVTALTQERDSLQSRLTAARARVDTLIERLPKTIDQDES